MSYLILAQMVALTGCSTSLPVESVVSAPPDQDSTPLHVLVFSKTAGFRHASIPTGVEALKTLGEQNGFTVEATEDSSAFTDANLARFSAVVFLSTTGDVLNDNQQAAFERYIRSGGGFLGIHAAADTEYDWPWYGRLVGAYFKTHPAIQDATVVVADRVHPSTKHLPMRWRRRDEWYGYRTNPRGKVHVLATLDESTYEGGGMGYDHPIAWCHEFDGGRAFYTGGGHTNESFAEPAFLQHLLGGILWTAGIEKADAGATRCSTSNDIIPLPARIRSSPPCKAAGSAGGKRARHRDRFTFDRERLLADFHPGSRGASTRFTSARGPKKKDLGIPCSSTSRLPSRMMQLPVEGGVSHGVTRSS